MGAGIRGSRVVGRLRRGPVPHLAASPDPGQRAPALGRWALVALAPAVRGGGRAAHVRRRTGLVGEPGAPVPAPLRAGLPRPPRARAALSALAGAGPALPPDGGARRVARRALRTSLLGRAVRPARGARRAAVGPPHPAGRHGACAGLLGRSSQPRRHPHPRRQARGADLGQGLAGGRAGRPAARHGRQPRRRPDRRRQRGADRGGKPHRQRDRRCGPGLAAALGGADDRRRRP